MATKYCLCGGCTTYSISIPKYCSECGRELAALFASEPAKPKIKIPKYIEPVEEEIEDEENDEIQSHSQTRRQSIDLDIEAELDLEVKPAPKFRDVFATQPPSPRSKPVKDKSYNKKAAIKAIRDRATPNRTPIDI